MAKKSTKEPSDSVAKAAEQQPVETVVTQPVVVEKKAKAKKAKSLVRGKIVAHDVKGLRKHTIKVTGEEIRFKAKKHPEKAGHHVQVHGKVVDGGVQLVTPAAQPNIIASLRAAGYIPPQSEVAFLTPKDFS